MPATLPSLLVVLGLAVAAVLLSWLYFGRFKITRPPIGVFNLTDIFFMSGGIILVPYLYLWLPIWLVAALLVVGTLSVLYFLWEPVLRSRLLVWVASLALVGADIWASVHFGTVSNQFFVVNDVVLLLMVVGLTNLWAQSGMKARDAAILGAFLALYDLTATSLLPLMTDMITRLAALPFSPMVGWAVSESDNGLWVGIGLGDLLLASVFPLVMLKAFGRGAGVTAMLVALGAIAALIFLPIAEVFPVMIVLGPLMVLQYIYWIRQRGQERTTGQYLQDESGSANSWTSHDSGHQQPSNSQKRMTDNRQLASDH
jgi:hypothetical protein